MRKALIRRDDKATAKLVALHSDRLDAERWRALLSSARIRVLTTAPQPHSNTAKGSRYLQIEFVECLADDALSVLPTAHELIAYVDHLRKKGTAK